MLLCIAVLAALSLLGLVAAQSALIQRWLSSNYEDGAMARQAAEIAFEAALHELLLAPRDSRTPGCVGSCFAPPYAQRIRDAGALSHDSAYRDDDWWQSQAQPVSPAGEAGQGDVDWRLAPHYLLEEARYLQSHELPAVEGAPIIDGVGYYRILARGAGRGPNATAVREAYVARPWPSDPLVPGGSVEEFCQPFRPWYPCGHLVQRWLRQ